MKKIVVLAIVLIMSLSLAGCSENKINIDGVKTNTIFIKEDGTIQFATFETFEKDYYKEDDAKEYIKEHVNKFNSAEGENSAVVDSFSVELDTAKLVITFSDMEKFSKFMMEYSDVKEVEYFGGTIEEALKKEYALSDTFLEASNGKQVEKSAILKDLKQKIVIIYDNADIVLESKIKYYTEGALLLDKHTIQPSNNGCMIIYK